MTKYPEFKDVDKKMMCVYVPVELYKAGVDVAKRCGHRNIQAYMVWLLCKDLLHEVADWSEYNVEDDTNE